MQNSSLLANKRVLKVLKEAKKFFSGTIQKYLLAVKATYETF